jgi:predicted XRE-type DNA-binding protein
MKKLPAHEVGSGNVFADLGLPDADELLLKAQLVAEIMRLMKRKKLSQAKTAALIGVAQPDLSNHLRGRTRGFSGERLMLMLTALERDCQVAANLKRHPSKRGGIRVRRKVV